MLVLQRRLGLTRVYNETNALSSVDLRNLALSTMDTRLYRRGEELRPSAPGVWIYTFVLFGLTIVIVLARVSARVYYKNFGLGEQKTDTIGIWHRHTCKYWKLTTCPQMMS